MDAREWPQPSRLKTWVDADGTRWTRSGSAPLTKAAARKLFADPGARIVHFYGSAPTHVDDASRPALWERVEAVLGGKGSQNPHSDIAVFRFRDEQGHVMHAVQESC